MSRVKRGTTKNKARKYLLAQTKGFRNGRKNRVQEASQAIFKAGTHAFNHRKQKKREFRRYWQIIISNALKQLGISYSVFMGNAHKKNMEVDRKILSTLAKDHPEIFNRVVNHVQ